LGPISEIVSACDAAAEAALAGSELSGYSRDGAFLLAGAWAKTALRYVTESHDGDAAPIVVDDADPLSAVEAIVRRLCAQQQAATATPAAD
jgi:hypothetical protein